MPVFYVHNQNHPKPFNSYTKISHPIPRTSDVVIKEEKQAGNYKIIRNSVNLSSSVYFYTLQGGDSIEN